MKSPPNESPTKAFSSLYFLFFPIFIFSIFAFGGCASAKFGKINTLPTEVEKGWVKFVRVYKGVGNDFCELPFIEEKIGPSDKDLRDIGRLGSQQFLCFDNSDGWLQVATNPGKHFYKISLGSYREIIKAEVLPNMITPVLIRFYDYSSSSIKTQYELTTTFHFTPEVDVCAPMTIKDDEAMFSPEFYLKKTKWLWTGDAPNARIEVKG